MRLNPEVELLGDLAQAQQGFLIAANGESRGDDGLDQPAFAAQNAGDEFSCRSDAFPRVGLFVSGESISTFSIISIHTILRDKQKISIKLKCPLNR